MTAPAGEKEYHQALRAAKVYFLRTGQLNMLRRVQHTAPAAVYIQWWPWNDHYTIAGTVTDSDGVSWRCELDSREIILSSSVIFFEDIMGVLK